MMVLGIDPGQTGGLAAVGSLNGKLTVAGATMTPLASVRTKVTLDIVAGIDWLNTVGVCDVGVIELVSAMPQQGVASTFQFGRMFGAAEAFLYASSNRQEYVTSAVWKKDMGLNSDKAKSRDLASRIFGAAAGADYWPLVKHDGVAEAALLAAWWLRKFGGAA